MDRPPTRVERQEPGNKEPRHLDRVRCISNRLGGVLSGHQNRRALVQQGETAPHKLLRTAGGVSSSENIPKGRIEHARPPTDGQSDGSILCKQYGRDSLRPGDTNCQRFLDVVPDKRDNVVHSAPTGKGQRSSRRGVESDEGSLRLDAEHNSVQADISTLPQHERRPVCVTADLPVTEILQLEARPASGSDGCPPTGLEGTIGYANPPWNLVGRVLSMVEHQEASLILVAPIWPSQPWYPKLLSQLVEIPLRIQPQRGLMLETREGCLPEVRPQLAVWPISGNATQARAFLKGLQTSSCLHGDGSHPNHMTHFVESGSAGVLNGIQIPFQDL